MVEMITLVCISTLGYYGISKWASITREKHVAQLEILGSTALNDLKAHKEHLNNYTEKALEVLGNIQEGITEQGKAQRAQAEEELTKIHQDNMAKLEERYEEQLAALEAEKDTLVGQQEKFIALMKEQKALVRDEIERMTEHFKETQEKEVTLHVLACAYQVVSANQKPRNEHDSALTNAVITHRKTGTTIGISEKPDEDGPESGDLN